MSVISQMGDIVMRQRARDESTVPELIGRNFLDMTDDERLTVWRVVDLRMVWIDGDGVIRPDRRKER